MSENQTEETAKDADLASATFDNTAPLTTNLGQPISDDQSTLRAGVRGPALLEDYIFREKIQHFDHERIPERIVHARGAAAHGYFQLTKSLTHLTTAKVLTDTSLTTPVFVRFSTVAGSRGSADTARDVRGFAVKMYTPDGNWDIVGNNIPIFFIQDAIKFPDLIHAAKPEPNNEIPQASTAHDTFYDFISLTPESMHMLMWIMSDRTLPRSFGMMDGFGVHTFRLINAEGKSTFVKFHFKPVLGAHSLVWDESHKLTAKDADFHRRDMWESIENGNFLEWHMGIQTIPDGEEAKLDFDILDATKLWPEDLFPVDLIGKLVLNRNPDNYFAETEQVAYSVTNLVPGIDFSNDPLLAGRAFSYQDTQLSRLGGPNFTEIPINRPLVEVSNNQRDAIMRTRIDKGRVSYAPASLDGHSPAEVTPSRPGFVSYPEPMSGTKIRHRSETFGDHYGQAKLFWNSMTPPEKEHITKALQFELSKINALEVQKRMLGHLAKINTVLAEQVAAVIAVTEYEGAPAAKPAGTSDSAAEMQRLADATSPTTASGGVQKTKGLSLLQDQPCSPKGRKVAILVGPGVDGAEVNAALAALKAVGATGEVVGPHLGALETATGHVHMGKTYGNSSSVTYDAVIVPAGAAALKLTGDARYFVAEAYKHGKAIGVASDAIPLLEMALPGIVTQANLASFSALGVITTDGWTSSGSPFIDLISKRHFGRPLLDQVAA